MHSSIWISYSSKCTLNKTAKLVVIRLSLYTRLWTYKFVQQFNCTQSYSCSPKRDSWQNSSLILIGFRIQLYDTCFSIQLMVQSYVTLQVVMHFLIADFKPFIFLSYNHSSNPTRNGPCIHPKINPINYVLLYKHLGTCILSSHTSLFS